MKLRIFALALVLSIPCAAHWTWADSAAVSTIGVNILDARNIVRKTRAAAKAAKQKTVKIIRKVKGKK